MQNYKGAMIKVILATLMNQFLMLPKVEKKRESLVMFGCPK
jgi:hypothetical protein